MKRPSGSDARGGRPGPATVGCLALALLLTVAGCATSGAPIPESAAALPAYVVGPADELSVRVLPDPAIERVVKVRPDGRFSMDLIGDVQAAGRTIAEIEAEIQQRIAEYRQSPAVTVALELPASTAVSVTGEVEEPKSFPLDRDIRLSEAIAQAKGATDLAAKSRVRVIRRSGPQEAALYVCNLDDIEAGRTASDLVLHPGDLVYVPPDYSVGVGYAVRRLLFPLEQVMRTIAGPILGFIIR